MPPPSTLHTSSPGHRESPGLAVGPHTGGLWEGEVQVSAQGASSRLDLSNAPPGGDWSKGHTLPPAGWNPLTLRHCAGCCSCQVSGRSRPCPRRPPAGGQTAATRAGHCGSAGQGWQTRCVQMAEDIAHSERSRERSAAERHSWECTATQVCWLAGCYTRQVVEAFHPTQPPKYALTRLGWCERSTVAPAWS